MFPEISKKPTVAIIYITYNRLYYTKKTLIPLLNSSKNKFKLYIVDNGSNDGTVEFLNQLEHPNIEQIIYNKKNLGLVRPTKKFWDETDAELVGKIDNDILVPPNWIENLVNAHKAINSLGVIGYCHFRNEDFNPTKLALKTEKINGITIRRQPWIGGNYLMKKSTIINYNGYRQSRKFFKKRILYGFNKYQEELTQKGFINGYLCNDDKSILTWEHIDDPRHQFFHKDENYYKIRNMSENDIIEWYKKDAKNLLE